MNRSIRSLAAGVAVAVCLWPVAAAAQDAPPPATTGPTVEEVRGVFSSAGFQVEPALNWDWTAPPVSTFRVHDPAHSRELMVLVYPNATAAQAERAQAQAHEQALNADGVVTSDRGPHLVIGYGQSAWRGNVALVQTTQFELNRAFQQQVDRDNGLYVAPQQVVQEPGLPSIAVDLDFLQALDNGAANF